MTKFKTATAAALASLVLAGAASAALAQPTTGVQSAVLTKMAGDNASAVTLDYGGVVDGGLLSRTAYRAPGETVTDVYASDVPIPGDPESEGRYVIIELAGSKTLADGTVVMQSAPVTVEGHRLLPSGQPIVATGFDS